MPLSLDAQTSVTPPPPSGAGSQTPPNPNTDATPLGGASATKPVGFPGAPLGSANAAGAPGASPSGAMGGTAGKNPAGAMGGPAQAPTISPEDINRYKAIQQSLYPDIVKAINVISHDETFRVSDASDEDINKIKGYLLELGWDSTYLSNEILRSNNVKDIRDFFSLVVEYQDKSNVNDLKQFENFIKQKDLSVSQQGTTLKMQEKQLDQTALQTQAKPLVVQEKLNQTKSSQYNERGTGMADVVVENGIIKTASPESPEIVAALFKATKTASRSIDSYKKAALLQAGAKALGESVDAFDESVLHKEVEASVSALQSKLAEAINFQKENDDPKVEDELSKFIGKGKETAEKGKSLFAPKEEPKKDVPAFGEKKDEPKKDEKPSEEKKEDKPFGEKKEEPKIGEPKKDEKPAFGEKKEEPKKEDKPSVKDILAAVKSEILGKAKTAQTTLPFKNLNKNDAYKDINADTASAAKKDTAGFLGEVKSESAKGLQNMNRDKSNLISPAQIEKIKSKAATNAMAKSKLAMELASQQQLKGLLPNPLKEAMVKNMLAAGLDEKTASAIAHNSFVDGYQPMQTVVMKETYANFANLSYDDFVKTAKFTLESGMVEPKPADAK